MGKRSRCELTRLVEQAVAEICGLPLPGLWFCVDAVEALGRPPHRFAVWAALHLHPEGSPFCCGEPGCHLGLLADRLLAVGDHLRRVLRLRQEVEVDLGDRIRVWVHPGVSFSVPPLVHTHSDQAILPLALDGPLSPSESDQIPPALPR